MNRLVSQFQHQLTLILALMVTLLGVAAAAGLLAITMNSSVLWSAFWWLASGGAIVGAVASFGLGLKKSAVWRGALIALAFLVLATWTLLPMRSPWSGWLVLAVLVIAFAISGRRLL